MTGELTGMFDEVKDAAAQPEPGLMSLTDFKRFEAQVYGINGVS